MTGQDEERTIAASAPVANDATVAMPTGPDDLLLGAPERTQMAIPVECPICYASNPAGAVYCVDCGFLLGSTPGERVEAAAPVASLALADGRELPLAPGRNSVGRMNAEVLLADPTVSRQHAVITLEGERCWVEDLGSTNGTRLNGERLEPHQPRALSSGDELVFGSVAVRIRLPDGFAAAPVAAGGEPALAPADSPARLVVEDTGAEFPLRVGTTSVGRRSANDIAFTEDRYVSGRHAEITIDGERVFLTDLGSTNGTTVNGDPVAAHVPVPLSDGDLITMGQQRLRVCIATASGDVPPLEGSLGDGGPDTAGAPHAGTGEGPS